MEPNFFLGVFLPVGLPSEFIVKSFFGGLSGIIEQPENVITELSNSILLSMAVNPLCLMGNCRGQLADSTNLLDQMVMKRLNFSSCWL